MEEGGELPLGLRFLSVIYERYQEADSLTEQEPDAFSDERETGSRGKHTQNIPQKRQQSPKQPPPLRIAPPGLGR